MTKQHVARMALDAIRIGRRHRRNLGDIDTLVASIRDLGLLHPPAVTLDGRLIAGRRRLEAVRRLGWREVPVNVVYLPCRGRGMPLGMSALAGEATTGRWQARQLPPRQPH